METWIRMAKMNDTAAWERLDANIDMILESGVLASVNRTILAFTMIYYTFCMHKFGVQENK